MPPLDTLYCPGMGKQRAPKKNPAAVELGKLRAASMTTEERSKAGKAGAKARKKLPAEQRTAMAKKAAAARWGKKGK